ncbi:MAG: hypothetical protein ACERKN_12305 [Velocimicrobium sp.]
MNELKIGISGSMMNSYLFLYHKKIDCYLPAKMYTNSINNLIELVERNGRKFQSSDI